jgi:hypothetical protein
MALQINLLHEEITAERRRQRDPLKIGMIVLAFVGTLMIAFYMWKAYQTLAIKNRLSGVQKEWAKVEPNVTAAKKRSAELTEIINTTKVLDRMIDDRFYWRPSSRPSRAASRQTRRSLRSTARCPRTAALSR